ncbi:hypothetical protein [Bacillus sp. RAR_GA_16]|uniref:hypothetical protein n=1 Tax=Bacillus sp. RAR_GA_16 TaxID=2876774 RepID=UPI001CD007B2|nr:hypothetical protein [Bacillus sp. RAR_GA_16]MCA0171207.1 hypothetical protein [Bacillus sp. RAR_GA_16]
MGHVVAAIYVTLGFLLFSFTYFDGFYLMWFEELGIGIIVFGVALHLYLFIKYVNRKQDENQSKEI